MILWSIEINMSDLKILIIIPAYNEEKSIKKVIDNIRKEFPYKCDIIVINDGSADETSKIAKAADVKVVDLIFNSGIGAAMQTGYLYAAYNEYDIAVQIDGDGQHNPLYLSDLIAPVVNDQADMAIGSRYIEKPSFKSSVSRRIGMIFLSNLIRLLTGVKVTDTTSGFRAINKQVIKKFSKTYPLDYPEPDVIVRLHKLNFRIMEIPVEMNQRQGGKSSITPIKSLLYIVKVSIAILINMIRSKENC